MLSEKQYKLEAVEGRLGYSRQRERDLEGHVELLTGRIQEVQGEKLEVIGRNAEVGERAKAERKEYLRSLGEMARYIGAGREGMEGEDGRMREENQGESEDGDLLKLQMGELQIRN